MPNVPNIVYTKSNDMVTFNKNPGPFESHFTSEVSTLFGNGDSPKEFTLTVAASGNTRTFKMVTRMVDKEGDVTGYIYRTNDDLPQMQFHLFND